MQRWEYQTIEVIKGKVNQVNNRIINKSDGKSLYALDEYLSFIGNEGWEVVLSGNALLMHSPDRIDGKDTVVLIAKRAID